MVPGVALLTALTMASGVEAQQKPKVELVTAVVRVLDSTGAPVPGVEVEFFVTRGDGTEDRRRGTSCGDGAASFEDVRADCIDFQASVLLASGRVDGKLRPCGDGLEAFVVLPSPVGVTAPAPATADTAPAPAATPPGPPPPAPAPEPEPEPAPEQPTEPEALAGPPAADGPEAREEPVALAFRLGIGFCEEWFYRPGPEDPSCGDDVSPALDLEFDVGWHLADWLVIGPRVGYGFFTSKTTAEAAGIGDGGSQTDPQGTVPAGDVEVEVADHRLHYGLGLRGIWGIRRLVLGAEFTPLGLFHQFTRAEGADAKTFLEFFVSAGVLAGLRIEGAWWLGAYARFAQPLPWVESQRFLPGALTFGVMAGTRFGFGGRSDADPGESRPAEPEPAAKPEDPDLERQKRFIETQQERGAF